MTETLGERIRQARERYGMSQAELSRRVGISKNAMNRIEVSKTPDPAASIVKAVAETLHVSADYLLGMNGQEAPAAQSPAPRRRTTAAVG